jgi:hypothetical protein
MDNNSTNEGEKNKPNIKVQVKEVQRGGEIGEDYSTCCRDMGRLH